MISRRLFLRNTAAAGAVGTTITAPAGAAEVRLSRRDQAIWHMRELERLAKEAGATSASVILAGRGRFNGAGTKKHPLLLINHSGELDDNDRMFEEARP